MADDPKTTVARFPVERRWHCWGDAFWHYASSGHDYADAAYRADEWEKRRAR